MSDRTKYILRVFKEKGIELTAANVGNIIGEFRNIGVVIGQREEQELLETALQGSPCLPESA